MVSAYGMVYLPKNLSTGNGLIPGGCGVGLAYETSLCGRAEQDGESIEATREELGALVVRT